MTVSPLDIFLAHSVELESEAQERYLELAESMAQHNNGALAEFFRRMAQDGANHLAEVLAMAAGRSLPVIAAWDFDWPEQEPPETASYEALHYRMSLRQGMELALQNEHAAERYYRDYANGAADEEVATAARGFADEEVMHATELQRLIESLPVSAKHHREEDDEPHMPE
jgi:rubrerythrin